jgi:hypothetical protein
MHKWKFSVLFLASFLVNSENALVRSTLCCASMALSPSTGDPEQRDAYLEGPLAVLFKLGQGLFRPKAETKSAPKEEREPSRREMKFRGYGQVSKNMNSSEILNLRLWMAAEAGNVNQLHDLLRKGANPNWRETRSWYYWSPLHVAAVDGHLDVVDTLVKAGADVNMADWDQWTPLHYAAYQGRPKHVKVARRLLDAGADVYEQTWNGKTPLALARAYNNTDAVAVLEAFERDEARKRGMHPRRSLLGRDGMRKDREPFLARLVAYAKRDSPDAPPLD